MQKFLALTTLNALDPLPALGRKVEAKAPAINMAPSAEEVFERTPHELHPQRPGPASSDVDGLFDAFVSEFQPLVDASLEWLHIDGNTRTGRFAFGSTACASSRGAELFGSFVPYGDQRDPREGQSGHGDARGHEASDLAHSRNTGSCERACREAKERFDANQGRAQGEAGRASAAGSALSIPPWTQGLSRGQLYYAYCEKLQSTCTAQERFQLQADYEAARRFARP
jgi:hypothetical protein